MKIKELYIAEFGGMKNRKITFDTEQGLNIIYGENESGKSTIFLFIKFMLYGLQRKSPNNNERERSLSWSGGISAGSMVVEHEGKDFRIERNFSDRAKGEKVFILSLDTGMVVITDKTPGEYFLGVPREVFESSACVGQMRSDDINGEKTAQSLSNILSSADEGVDVSNVLRELNLVRASYLHKNQGGGMIYEDEIKINALKIKLEEAKNTSMAIEERSNSFDAVKREYEAMKLELEENDAILSQLNKIAIIKRFEALRESENDLAEVLAKKEACVSAILVNDYFPDRNHVAELHVASRELAEREELVEGKERKINEYKPSYNEELASHGQHVEDCGGKLALLSAITTPLDKAFFKLKVGVALGILAILTAVVGVVCFKLIDIVTAVIMLVIALGFGIAAIVASQNGAKARSKHLSELEEIAKLLHTTVDDLDERIDESLIELNRMREYKAEIEKISTELDLAEESLEASKRHAYNLLKLTLGEDAEPECKTLDDEAARIDALLNQYDGLAREEDTILRVIENERNSLARFDEEKLRSEITVNIEAATPEAIEAAERSKNFLLAKKASYENKIINLQNELVALRVKAEDPLPIADRLALLEEKTRKDRKFYDALVCAMNAIEESSAAMRGNVTPVISKNASEFLARMSGEKYNTLRTNSKLGILLDKDGFSISSELLSAGTKDTAYLSLRLALIMQIYKNSRPPIIFDESFCQLDDRRLANTIDLLHSLAGDGMQVIMFTSHLREGEACRKAEFEYNEIIL